MTLNGVNIRRYDRGDKQFKILACENGLIGPGRILKKNSWPSNNVQQ